jgi:peptide/nickel transport system substrate-binding protein
MKKKQKSPILGILLGLALAAILAGCSGKGKQSGPKDTLVVILPNDFTTLDPQRVPATLDINFISNIFDTLVTLDDNQKIIPSLAKSWTVSSDGLSYTFELEQGISFHNGKELTASDVVFSVGRFMSEEWMEFGSFSIKGAEALDDYTVRLNLKYPYAKILSLLVDLFIIDEETFKEQGEDRAAREPIGTGAYKFVSWNPEQEIRLEAFDDYFRGKPPIKNLIFKIIPDSNTAFVALETGEADLSFTAPAADYLHAKDDPDLATAEIAGSRYVSVAYNAERINEKTRQALSYAVNREALNTIVTEGTGTLTYLPLVPGEEGYTTDLVTYPYDPQKARDLLKAAGKQNLKIDFFFGQSAQDTKIGQTLQAQWGEVGVSLELKPVETGTWWQLFGEGDYDVSRAGYPMFDDNTDVSYFDAYHRTGTYNVGRVNDPDVNALLDEARIEQDPSKRSGLYIRVNQILAERAYHIPLFFVIQTVIYNKDLKNIKPLRNQRYQYRDFSW